MAPSLHQVEKPRETVLGFGQEVPRKAAVSAGMLRGDLRDSCDHVSPSWCEWTDWVAPGQVGCAGGGSLGRAPEGCTFSVASHALSAS